MEVFNSIFSWVIKRRISQIEHFKKYPNEVQVDCMKSLLSEARNTEKGRAFDFKSITSAEQFKDTVPLMDYEDLKTEVVRLKRGEQNIAWPSEIKWFAKSSGTTNDKSKFIPVSKESLQGCHYNGGKDMLSLYYHNVPDSKLFSGKTLILGGSNSVGKFGSGAYYGDLSSIIIDNLPFWVEARRIPGKSIALMGDWEQKIQRMAEATSVQNVSNISGVPSWTLLILRRILEITGASHIKEVWPNLELFMHGGVSFSPYVQQYREIMGPSNINYLEAFNASEGLFGIQDVLGEEGMLLMLDYGTYYEFIPERYATDEQPETITLAEVELGEVYALVITTNAGLWRYKVGDLIQFISVDPYKIKVVGRTKHYINAFGEELMIDNAEKAIAVACERTGAVVADYTAAPIHMNNGPGGHEWCIEFERAPVNVDFFAEVLDTALKSLNSDYEAKRYKGLAMQKPLIRMMPRGTFYGWFSERGRLGGQNKIPRLYNDRKYIDQLTKMVNTA